MSENLMAGYVAYASPQDIVAESVSFAPTRIPPTISGSQISLTCSITAMVPFSHSVA
jgi:hypothetical protein